MSYEKTIIIEASHSNTEEDSPNDFTINIPNLNVPKMSSISLDGAIIQQEGANENMIEVSNKNYSEKYPYTSSFMGIENIFYINHNGFNMVAFPLSVRNMFETTGDGKIPEGSNVAVIRYRQKIFQFVNFLVLGKDATEEVYYYLNDFDSTGRSAILYENTPTDGSFDYSPRFFKDGFQPTEPALPDAPQDGRQEYPQAGGDFRKDEQFGIASPANLCTAINQNGPDGSKWVYMDNFFSDPVRCVPHNPETDFPPRAFKGYMNIDLGDKLIESPDELIFKINNQWTATKINSEDNIVPIVGGRYDIDQEENISFENIKFSQEKCLIFQEQH